MKTAMKVLVGLWLLAVLTKGPLADKLKDMAIKGRRGKLTLEQVAEIRNKKMREYVSTPEEVNQKLNH